MKCSHSMLIVISGLIWLAIGIFLLPLGLKFLLEATHSPEPNFPLLNPLTSILGQRELATILLIVFGLIIGYYKGTYVLGRSAKRVVKRITSQPNPASLSCLYSLPYLLLIGVMVIIGMSIKFFGLALDIRGFIDVAIGAALINGALVYFRMAKGNANA